MKTILVSLLLLAAAVVASAQTATNNGIDLVWSQALDDTLKTSWRIDENLRTNGIAPYTVATNAITYKVFLANLLSAKAAESQANLAAQNEAAFLAASRFLKTNNPSAYNKLIRVAFQKGSQ